MRLHGVRVVRTRYYFHMLFCLHVDNIQLFISSLFKTTVNMQISAKMRARANHQKARVLPYAQQRLWSTGSGLPVSRQGRIFRRVDQRRERLWLIQCSVVLILLGKENIFTKLVWLDVLALSGSPGPGRRFDNLM